MDPTFRPVLPRAFTDNQHPDVVVYYHQWVRRSFTALPPFFAFSNTETLSPFPIVAEYLDPTKYALNGPQFMLLYKVQSSPPPLSGRVFIVRH